MPPFPDAQQDRPQDRDKDGHHDRHRGDQFIRGKPGDVAQAADKSEVAQLQGCAVDVHLIPADDGQGHGEPGPRHEGDEEPPGQAVDGKHQANKQQPEQGRGGPVGGHPSKGRDQILQPNDLGGVEGHKGREQQSSHHKGGLPPGGGMGHSVVDSFLLFSCIIPQNREGRKEGEKLQILIKHSPTIDCYSIIGLCLPS